MPCCSVVEQERPLACVSDRFVAQIGLAGRMRIGYREREVLTKREPGGERSDTPILILSARGGEKDEVAALDEGADDYVTKPFGPEELMARVRAALRRSHGRERTLHGRLTTGDLTIDFDRRRVYRGAIEIRLTPKEFDLLTLLAANAGRVLTHRTILKAIWGTHVTDHPEHLRVLMGQLRRKVEADPSAPRYLLTEPWVGYRFAEERD
jgi:two-component system, OmpR family, KDP operon response regulator KdpE